MHGRGAAGLAQALAEAAGALLVALYDLADWLVSEIARSVREWLQDRRRGR